MATSEFEARLSGQGVLTAEILYHMPDHPGLLQTFLWQTLDSAPSYPRLQAFLDHWRREIDAMIHSIRVAHSDWVGPTEWRMQDADFLLN